MISRANTVFNGSTSPDAVAPRALARLSAFPRLGTSMGPSFGLAAKPNQP